MLNISTSLFNEGEGRKVVTTVMENKNKVLAVHYSCESIKCLRTNTPRITSISVFNFATRVTKSFSLHIEAEHKKYQLNSLNKGKLDAAERSMLKKFYTFAKKHQYQFWVHWCMKNSTYGFEALENRFLILSGKSAPRLMEQNRIDLSTLLVNLYGQAYESKESGSKFMALLKRNQLASSGILSGEQEAYAFDDKNFQAIMRSNQDKAEAIGLILEAAAENKLKTATTGYLNKICDWRGLRILLWIGNTFSKANGLVSTFKGMFGISTI